MQDTISPCIWGRLENIIIINPAAVLCAGIFMFSKWLGHSGAISTKDLLHKVNSYLQQQQTLLWGSFFFPLSEVEDNRESTSLLLFQWKNSLWVSAITWHQVAKGILLQKGALCQCPVNFWRTQKSPGSEDFWDSHAASTCNTWVAESILFSRKRKTKDISCCMNLCFPRIWFTTYLNRSLAWAGQAGK